MITDRLSSGGPQIASNTLSVIRNLIERDSREKKLASNAAGQDPIPSPQMEPRVKLSIRLRVLEAFYPGFRTVPRFLTSVGGVVQTHKSACGSETERSFFSKPNGTFWAIAANDQHDPGSKDRCHAINQAGTSAHPSLHSSGLMGGESRPTRHHRYCDDDKKKRRFHIPLDMYSTIVPGHARAARVGLQPAA